MVRPLHFHTLVTARSVLDAGEQQRHMQQWADRWPGNLPSSYKRSAPAPDRNRALASLVARPGPIVSWRLELEREPQPPAPPPKLIAPTPDVRSSGVAVADPTACAGAADVAAAAAAVEDDAFE